MQIFVKHILFLAIVWGVTGCHQPSYREQEGAFIIWKSPQLRYADQGFIYKAPNATKVEIYSSGTPVMTLEIGTTSVCANFWACVSKSSFNAKYLSPYYPDDTIAQIFRGEAIFDGVRKQRTRNGFTQQLSKPGKYHIDYKVFNNKILFHDTITQIEIKVIRQ